MTDKAPRLPKYRHYKPKDLAVVRIDGRDVYLGKFDSPESREKYKRVVAEWLTAGSVTAPVPSAAAPPPPLTIAELVLAYWTHAKEYYRGATGAPSAELDNIKDALKPLRALYGLTPARDFGPLALRAVRDEMVRSGLARTTVNARVHRVRRAFTWAAGVQLVSGSVVADLKTDEALKKGRTDAPEPDEVGPVPVETVEATLPFLSPAVRAMVLVQLYTGCRAGEVMAMRGRDLTPGADVWDYKPTRHKNSWRGQSRAIALGPKAVAVLSPFLTTDRDSYLFSPRATVETVRAARAQARKSKPTPSELARRQRRKGHVAAAKYDRRTYRQAVVRACDKAFPHPTLAAIRAQDLTPEQRAELHAWRKARRWSPLQLRHTSATTIRAQFGLEAAQNVLGHARADTTELYAERDQARARSVMSEIG